MSKTSNLDYIQEWADTVYILPRKPRQLPLKEHVTVPRPSCLDSQERRVRVRLGDMTAGETRFIEGVRVYRTVRALPRYSVADNAATGFERAVELIIGRAYPEEITK